MRRRGDRRVSHRCAPWACAPWAVSAVRLCAVGLCAVLDEGHTGRGRHGHEGGHVREPAVEVGDDDGGHAGCLECRAQAVGRHVQAGLVHVDIEGVGAGRADGRARIGPGVGHGQDRVTGAHVQGSQGDLQGIGPAGDAEAVARAAVVGEGAFEALDLRPQDVATARQHAPDRGADVHAGLDGVEGEYGHVHVGPS